MSDDDIQAVTSVFDGILRNNPNRIAYYLATIHAEAAERLSPAELGVVVANNIVQIARGTAEFEHRQRLFPSDFILAIRYYRSPQFPWGYPREDLGVTGE